MNLISHFLKVSKSKEVRFIDFGKGVKSKLIIIILNLPFTTGKIFCDKSLGLAKGLSSAWDQPGIGLLRREGPKHGIKNQGSTHH